MNTFKAFIIALMALAYSVNSHAKKRPSSRLLLGRASGRSPIRGKSPRRKSSDPQLSRTNGRSPAGPIRGMLPKRPSNAEPIPNMSRRSRRQIQPCGSLSTRTDGPSSAGLTVSSATALSLASLEPETARSQPSPPATGRTDTSIVHMDDLVNLPRSAPVDRGIQADSPKRAQAHCETQTRSRTQIQTQIDLEEMDSKLAEAELRRTIDKKTLMLILQRLVRHAGHAKEATGDKVKLHESRLNVFKKQCQDDPELKYIPNTIQLILTTYRIPGMTIDDAYFKLQQVIRKLRMR